MTRLAFTLLYLLAGLALVGYGNLLLYRKTLGAAHCLPKPSAVRVMV